MMYVNVFFVRDDVFRTADSCRPFPHAGDPTYFYEMRVQYEKDWAAANENVERTPVRFPMGLLDAELSKARRVALPKATPRLPVQIALHIGPCSGTTVVAAALCRLDVLR